MDTLAVWDYDSDFVLGFAMAWRIETAFGYITVTKSFLNVWNAHDVFVDCHTLSHLNSLRDFKVQGCELERILRKYDNFW